MKHNSLRALAAAGVLAALLALTICPVYAERTIRLPADGGLRYAQEDTGIHNDPPAETVLPGSDPAGGQNGDRANAGGSRNTPAGERDADGRARSEKPDTGEYLAGENGVVAGVTDERPDTFLIVLAVVIALAAAGAVAAAISLFLPGKRKKEDR